MIFDLTLTPFPSPRGCIERYPCGKCVATGSTWILDSTSTFSLYIEFSTHIYLLKIPNMSAVLVPN